MLEVDGSGQSAGACVVKEYVRAGAGHLIPSPTDLRPARVLLDTMQYLVTRYMCKISARCLCKCWNKLRMNYCARMLHLAIVYSTLCAGELDDHIPSRN